MSVSLSKNQKISLSKNEAGLKKVFMGLGWDAAKPKVQTVKPSGFFARLFGSPVKEVVSSVESIDLDASCLMFDADNKNVDTIWFRKLKTLDGSVWHSGDNLTGDGDGDDEVINVNLTALPEKIKTLVFVITSFRGQTFDMIESANCRLVNAENNKELAKYTLSGEGKNTAQIMAKVYRENGEWMMQAIGAPANGTVQHQIISEVEKYL